MDDLTEMLDWCGADVLQFRLNLDGHATLNGGPLVESRSRDDQEFDLSLLASFIFVRIICRVLQNYLTSSIYDSDCVGLTVSTSCLTVSILEHRDVLELRTHKKLEL